MAAPIKPKLNIIGIQDSLDNKIWGMSAIAKEIQKSPPLSHNLFVLGSDLNSAGAELLSNAIEMQSLYTLMFNDGGACIPFGAEGHFGSGYRRLLRETPEARHQFGIVVENGSGFSAEQWQNRIVGAQCLLLEKPMSLILALSKLWLHLKDLLSTDDDYYLKAELINHFVTAQGAQDGQLLLDGIIVKLNASLVPEQWKAIFAFAEDENIHPFIRLFHLNKIAKEHHQVLAKHMDADFIKFLGALFCDKQIDKKYQDPRLHHFSSSMFFEKKNKELLVVKSSSRWRAPLISMVGMLLLLSAQAPALIGLASYSLMTQGLAMFSLSYLSTKVGQALIKQLVSHETAIAGQDHLSQRPADQRVPSGQAAASLNNQPLIFSASLELNESSNQSMNQDSEPPRRRHAMRR